MAQLPFGQRDGLVGRQRAFLPRPLRAFDNAAKCGTIMDSMKKLRFPGEAAYVCALVLLAFSVAMTAAADFGVSMVVAPAYILSLKTGLTFGLCEYICQSALFIALCLLIGRLRAVYFCAFLSTVLYGAALDMWRLLIPAFNPSVTPPGAFPFAVRVALLAVGMTLSALAIALCFRSYIYPQVNDFFVQAVSGRFGIDRTRFKIGYDATSLLLACAMTLLFFGALRGLGVGTLVMTVLNGLLIDLWGRLLDAAFDFTPRFPKLAAHFALPNSPALRKKSGNRAK